MARDQEVESSSEIPEYLSHVPEAEQEAEAPKVPRTGILRFARTAGSSIAGPDAAPWITGNGHNRLTRAAQS
jgi:hypothetical protein